MPTIRCTGCVSGLQHGLLQLDGVGDVSGDPAVKTLIVTYDRRKTDEDTIRAAIAALGHRAG
ncbi:MAG: heavy-metal-associated domain-containing protein [Anaerolineae bacterium]